MPQSVRRPWLWLLATAILSSVLGLSFRAQDTPVGAVTLIWGFVWVLTLAVLFLWSMGDPKLSLRGLAAWAVVPVLFVAPVAGVAIWFGHWTDVALELGLLAWVLAWFAVVRMAFVRFKNRFSAPHTSLILLAVSWSGLVLGWLLSFAFHR